jgi:hypothetical protein
VYLCIIKQKGKKMKNLTDNEQKVFNALKSNSLENEDNAFDIDESGLKRCLQLNGILSSLQKKGLIECWEDCYFDGCITKKGLSL